MHRACHLACLLTGIAWSLAASGDWSVAEETMAGAAAPTSVARVESEDGRKLAVYRDDDGLVRAAFGLGDGLASLDAHTCPSYRVDEEPPVRASFDDGNCLLQPGTAVFTIGRVADARITSDALLAFMNGTVLEFRYHLGGLGYFETRFSLRRSKQALRTAVGRNVRVNGNGE